MTAAREELRLVTDFDELGRGIRLLILGCGYCGGSHEMTTDRLLVGRPGFDSNGRRCVGDVWVCTPPPPCFSPTSLPPAVGPLDIATNQIFRFVDSTLESDSSHASRRDRLLEEVTK